MDAVFYMRVPDMYAEKTEWPVGNGRRSTAKEREVHIEFCITEYFRLVLRQSCNDEIKRVGSEQKTFQKTSIITRSVEDVLYSTDLEAEVADMFIRAAHIRFKPYAKPVSKFIHRKACTLGPEYQMLRIIVQLKNVSEISCEEGYVMPEHAMDGLETVERISPCVEETMMCPICLENLTEDSEKNDEAVIMRAPCGHLFHGNCIKTWMEMNRICPMCRFKMPLQKFELKLGELIWICETNFKNIMHITPPDEGSN